MDTLGNRGDFALCELADRVARHRRDFALQPRVVHAARCQDGAAKVAEAALVRAVPDRSLDLGLAERVVEHGFGKSEIFEVRIDVGRGALADLRGEAQGQPGVMAGIVAPVCPRGPRIFQRSARRLDLGRQICQPLGVDLMFVDAFPVAGQRAPMIQRGVTHLLQRSNDKGGLFEYVGHEGLLIRGKAAKISFH